MFFKRQFGSPSDELENKDAVPVAFAIKWAVTSIKRNIYGNKRSKHLFCLSNNKCWCHRLQIKHFLFYFRYNAGPFGYFSVTFSESMGWLLHQHDWIYPRHRNLVIAVTYVKALYFLNNHEHVPTSLYGVVLSVLPCSDYLGWGLPKLRSLISP